MARGSGHGLAGWQAWLAWLAALAALRSGGAAGQLRRGFLLDFLTKAMIWPGSGKTFSWISLPTEF